MEGMNKEIKVFIRNKLKLIPDEDDNILDICNSKESVLKGVW